MSKAKKPADKATIKDLLKEKDVFLTTSERAYEYFLRNTRLLAGIGIAVLVVIVAVTVYVNHRKAAEAKASTAYDKAYEMLADGKSGLTAIIESMEKVKADYAGNKASRMAALTLVSLYAEAKDYEKAISAGEEFLQSIQQAEISLKPVLLYRLAELYELNQSFDKSIGAYEALLATDAGQDPLEKAFRADILMAIGRVKNKNADQKGAIEAYEKVISEAPGSVQAYLSNYKVVELTGKPRSVYTQDLNLLSASVNEGSLQNISGDGQEPVKTDDKASGAETE